MYGRPLLVKRSVCDERSKVKIAAMYPDFDVRHMPASSLMESADRVPNHSRALAVVLGLVRVCSVTVVPVSPSLADRLSNRGFASPVFGRRWGPPSRWREGRGDGWWSSGKRG